MSNQIVNSLKDIPVKETVPGRNNSKKHSPGTLEYKDGIYTIAFTESEAVPVLNKSGKGYHITVVFEPTGRIGSRCVNLMVR